MQDINSRKILGKEKNEAFQNSQLLQMEPFFCEIHKSMVLDGIRDIVEKCFSCCDDTYSPFGNFKIQGAKEQMVNVERIAIYTKCAFV